MTVTMHERLLRLMCAQSERYAVAHRAALVAAISIMLVEAMTADAESEVFTLHRAPRTYKNKSYQSKAISRCAAESGIQPLQT